MNSARFKAVLFDWAGTTVDYGSRAPTQVFLEIFRRRGVEIHPEEARGPMGRAKHEHIAMIAAVPRVAALWEQRHGAAPTEADVLTMYHDFLPLQKEILRTGSSVISGVADAVVALRSRGLRIGSTTGYTQELMDVVIPIAAAQGYLPDVAVCSDHVGVGRPAPWMNVRAAEMLGAWPFRDVVVVDDTPVGIEAGKNAGMLAIGVTQTGNGLGLSEAEVAALSSSDLSARLSIVEAEFRSAGADFVIPSVADLPDLLRRIV